MSLDEEVLCVPAVLIEQLGAFEGFQPEVERYLPTILDKKNQTFIARRLCETDPSQKQLIPYVLIRYSDETGTYIFQYVRGKGQGEKRLHALRSIGIGGHISTDDTTGDDWYRTGMARELEEEVIFEKSSDAQIIGLIYDPSNDVGKVHLGIVHLMELDGPTVRAREEDLLEAGFLPIETIVAEIDRLETWSRLCIEYLLAATPKASASTSAC